MDKRLKVGDVYLEIKQNPSGPGALPSSREQLKAEKPETPEPLEEPVYVYRPNDPFQSSIDEMRAITSISASHKSWVKKTWFILFVVGPLVYAELFALGLAFGGDGNANNPVQAILLANAFILPLWFAYYTIWRKNVKK